MTLMDARPRASNPALELQTQPESFTSNPGPCPGARNPAPDLQDQNVCKWKISFASCLGAAQKPSWAPNFVSLGRLAAAHRFYVLWGYFWGYF
jgi:hypothetical protein